MYCILCTLYKIRNIVSAHNDFLLIGDRSRQARQGTQTNTTTNKSQLDHQLVGIVGKINLEKGGGGRYNRG